MARTATFPLYDELKKGRLGKIIREARHSDPQIAYETIAYRIRTELGLTVSTATVRRWSLQYGLEPGADKAS